MRLAITGCLAALFLAPACAQTQRGHGHSSRPSAAPPDVDCAVRKLASAYVPEPKTRRPPAIHHTTTARVGQVRGTAGAGGEGRRRQWARARRDVR